MKRLGIILILLLYYLPHAGASSPESKADSLLKIWNNKQLVDTIRIKAIKQLAWECYAFVNTDSAVMYAALGYNFAKQKGNKKYMSMLLNTMGSIKAIRGDFSEAIEHLKEALKIQQSSNDNYGISKTYNNIGYIYRNQGKFSEALDYQLKSIEIQEKYHYTDFRLTTLINIGITYQEFNDYDRALKYYIKALKMAEENHDVLQIADIQNNIGLIYINQKDYEKAREIYIKNVEIYKKANNILGLAPSYLNIGICYVYENKSDSALANYKKAIYYFEKVGDKHGILKTLNNAGTIYEKNKDFEPALEYFMQSLALNKALDSKKEMAITLGKIGYIYKQQNKLSEAKKYLEEALNQAKESGAVEEIGHSASYLWDFYKTTHQYEKALQMHELFSLMKDSVSSDEKQKELLKATIKFGYEKKAAADSVANAKQIEIKNVELNNQRIQIRAKRNEQIALFVGLALVLVFSGFLFNRYKITQHQKVIIETAHQSLEIKSKEILDSINYSKRIQNAILPPERIVKEYLKDSFILYLPKDIVAGDFYWMEKIGNKIYLAACDCTGHGVPGALVSVVCNNALNRAVNEFGERQPGKIFDKTRELVLENFAKSDEDVKDGMDASLAVFDTLNMKLEWSGANNPLWIYRKVNHNIEEIKSDKQPIGKGYESKPFTTHHVLLNEGDIVYLFTDGYADQFGGGKAKKLTKARLRELILSMAHESMAKQKELLQVFHQEFKGDEEQVDDICIIGVRV
jgi:tetratricopeptide (TPR) repeat protein